ncbi:MAG: transglycosylase domain-containing protein [Microbacteriaceae bacterium]
MPRRDKSPSEPAPAPAPKAAWRRRFGIPAILAALVTIVAVPVLVVTSGTAVANVAIFQDDDDDSYDISAQPQQNRIYAIKGYDDDGNAEYKQIATVYSQNRQEITWDEVSDSLKYAVLAAEDHRFYEHGAVDLQGVIRAALSTLTGDTQGGSTLTQQLVKNICIADAFKEYPNQAEDADELAAYQAAVADCQAQTLSRKLTEMKAAVQLEKKYSKDEILLAYLNIANYGGTVYGIQSAAERYYDKDAADLTTVEAASLIAIVQTPEALRLDDEDNYTANTARRDTILANELKYGYIDQSDYDQAVAVVEGGDGDTLSITTPRNGCIAANKYARQFCDYVVKNVKNYTMLGDTEDEREANWRVGGYSLYTTLDLRLQEVAQDAVRQYAPADETLFELGASAVTVQAGTGRVLTMAQNKSFDDTGTGDDSTTAVNFNTDKDYGGSSGFQVGSTYKVFTLINWLEHDHGLNEVVNANARTVDQSDFTDSCPDPTSLTVNDSTNPWGGTYTFKNDSGGGYQTVRAATAASINGAYISMALQLDLCDTKTIAQSLGVHLAAGEADGSDLETLPSSVLGINEIAPLTVAAAYAAIADNGVYCAPVVLDDVVDASGTDLGGQEQSCTQAIPEQVAIATQSALQTAMDGYVSNPGDGTDLIGKTGTTNDSNQTWVTGASTAAATTVWYGNITGSYPIRSYSGGGTYGGNQRHLIEKAILTEMDELYPGGEFSDPESSYLTGVKQEVGDYVGLDEDDAAEQIVEDGFTYDESSVSTVTSDEPKGTVVDQSPTGTAVKGAIITLKVSDGKGIDVPDVVGLDEATAESTLADAGLKNVKTYCVATGDTTANDTDGDGLDDTTGEAVVTGEYTTGTVAEQAPDAGTVKTADGLVRIGIAQPSC